MSKVQAKTTARPRRRLSPIKGAAAAIDIGATFDVVAVGEERSERAVRSFPNLYVRPLGVSRLAQRGGDQNRRDGIDRGLVDPGV
jgi:hypothetical protein